jgi:hypothetical protein
MSFRMFKKMLDFDLHPEFNACTLGFAFRGWGVGSKLTVHVMVYNCVSTYREVGDGCVGI